MGMDEGGPGSEIRQLLTFRSQRNFSLNPDGAELTLLFNYAR